MCVLDRSRFGILNLVKYNSDLLINLIQEQWVAFCFPRGFHAEALIIQSPEHARAVDVELARCRRELDKLPQKSMEAPKTIIRASGTLVT